VLQVAQCELEALAEPTLRLLARGQHVIRERAATQYGRTHELEVERRAAAEWMAALAEYIHYLGDPPSGPIFRYTDENRRLTAGRLTRGGALRVVKKLAKRAHIPTPVCCHSFRATAITTYLSSGGTLERAQAIAGHSDIKTTRMYDRRDDDVTAEELDRIEYL
jgi:integrase